MTVDLSNRRVGAARMAAIARELLDASTLCAIATVTRGGRAHINTAYFAWTRHFELVWLSEPRAGHSRNLRGSGSAAVAVYDSRQTWGKPDRGIQLFGSAREARGAAAETAATVYARRFRQFAESEPGAYRLYVFKPRSLKLFDERALGAGTFVTARVGRGGRLAWDRTEIYRSSG